MMNRNQTTCSEEDFDFARDAPKEDPAVAQLRLVREDQITKKLGEYLLKGYCMLGDTCEDCNCILLRTPDKRLFCVACEEIDLEKKTEEAPKKKKKKDRAKKSKGKKEAENEVNFSQQLENKLKWAVDELTKSQNANRINEMCSVIIKLTEALKALKELDLVSSSN